MGMGMGMGKERGDGIVRKVLVGISSKNAFDSGS